MGPKTPECIMVTGSFLIFNKVTLTLTLKGSIDIVTGHRNIDLGNGHYVNSTWDIRMNRDASFPTFF